MIAELENDGVTMQAFCEYLQNYFSDPNALTVREVAERVGLHRVSLSRIIHGHHEPTLPMAEKIAEATGSRLSKILKKMELSA